MDEASQFCRIEIIRRVRRHSARTPSQARCIGSLGSRASRGWLDGERRPPSHATPRHARRVDAELETTRQAPSFGRACQGIHSPPAIKRQLERVELHIGERRQTPEMVKHRGLSVALGRDDFIERENRQLKASHPPTPLRCRYEYTQQCCDR